eukprot:2603207-Prymnesium_polylepis.1
MPLGVNISHFRETASTSHEVSQLTGLAELLHNAFDADASRVDVRVVQSSRGQDLLLFSDNGLGLDRNELTQMLTLGSDRMRLHCQTGRYGVGFKNGVMKNAEGAIIFTTHVEGTMSVALFSLSWAEEAEKEQSGPTQQKLDFPILTLDDRLKVIGCSLLTTAGEMQSLEDASTQFWDLIERFSPFTVKECYAVLTRIPLHVHVDPVMKTTRESGCEIYLF